MKIRLLIGLSVLGLAACQGPESTMPSEPREVPSLAISDGAHSGGNVDFFFLPPVVLPTGPLTNWTQNGFNGSLSPTVSVCRLVATTVPQVGTPAGSLCRSSPAPVTYSGSQVKKHFPPLADPGDVITGLPGDWAHYHAKFPIPSNCNGTFFYRVSVKVGDVELGFADVRCVTNLFGLLTLDYKKFGPALKGTTLQIPFRVERYALCPTPGVGPCATASIPLSTGGTVGFTDPDGHTIGAVEIPAQGPSAPTVTVSVSSCTDAAGLPVDLPKFGSCVTITTDPVGVELSNPASVFVCDLADDLDLSSLSPAQKARVTLHRQSGALLQALPHVTGCASENQQTGSVKGLMRALVQRDWKRARGQVFDLLAPKPLYALDVGAGGLTFEFSNFQFALPAKMEILSGDGQTAPPGTQLPANPTVIVTDLLGEPVNGATVNFSASAGGAAGAPSVVTGPDGLANVTWTLAATPGPNSLVASGRGIADPVNNGPRVLPMGASCASPHCDFDPFMAIQGAFNPSGEAVPSPLQPVSLQTGSLTFTASGADNPIPVPFVTGGYDYLVFNPAAAGPPAGWETVAYVPTGWSNGASPFGSGDQSGCGYTPATTWGIDTDILVRKTFTLGSSQNVLVKVAIDNDVKAVYLNGVELSDGIIVHEGCANPAGDLYYYGYGIAQAGSNLIAIHGSDRGGSSYLDVQVELIESCEFCESELVAMPTSGTAADPKMGPRVGRSSRPVLGKPHVVQLKPAKRAIR